MNHLKKYKTLILLLVVFDIAILIIKDVTFPNQVEVYYYGNNSSSYQGIPAQMFWGDENEYTETNSQLYEIYKRLAVFSYKAKSQPLESIRLDFTNQQKRIGIHRIEVRSGLFSTYTLSGLQLADVGVWNNCIVEKEADYIWITPTTEDPSVIINGISAPEFIQRIQSDKFYKIGILSLVMFFELLIGVFIVCLRKKQIDKLYCGFMAIGMVVFSLVIGMGMFSIAYGHPDEDETRGSIDYYLTNWDLPDFDDATLDNAYSNYGTIRLTERSVYYILAGKVGAVGKYLFHISCYYRLFNIILFFVLLCWIAKWGKENKWMFAFLFATPQLWYIFSYATSDAWDMFVAFFVIGELLRKDNWLDEVFRYNWNKKTIFGVLVYALLCAQLLMGKRNYLIVLLFAFVILLIRWLDDANKKHVFIKYTAILGSVFAMVGLRNLVDRVRYPEGKNNLYRIEVAKHRSQEIIEYQSLQKQGYAYWETLIAIGDGLIPTMFASFVGCYGWMTLYSGQWYVLAMAFLYVLSIGYTVYHCKEKRLVLMILACILLMGVFVIYQMWCRDYQAQGRYLLPWLLGYVAILSKSNIWNKKLFITIQFIISALGVISFVCWGLLPLCSMLVH